MANIGINLSGFDSINDTERAVVALKYMLLSKIMLRLHDDITLILGGKYTLRYAGEEVEAMKLIAKASKNRSLDEFQQALRKYSKQLENDAFISSHLNTLYDQMLEQNLLKIIEPYSKVQVSAIFHPFFCFSKYCILYLIKYYTVYRIFIYGL